MENNEISYKGSDGLTVETTYMDIEFAKKQQHPIQIVDRHGLFIEVEKDNILWLRDHLNQIYTDLFESEK